MFLTLSCHISFSRNQCKQYNTILTTGGQGCPDAALVIRVMLEGFVDTSLWLCKYIFALGLSLFPVSTLQTCSYVEVLQLSLPQVVDNFCETKITLAWHIVSNSL